MPLIGRNTVTGNFIKCSNLTPDGSTTTFTLTNSKTSDNVYPGDQNSLLVSVSGVIQNPGTSYTINNNQITFTTAPSISDTIDFIVIMGDLVAIGTPSDDTVDTVHIKNGAVHNTKLANSSITINGTSIALGASGDIVAGTDWQSVVTADGSTATTAAAGQGFFIDTTSATHTVNLPASPSIGDTVSIVDYAGTFGTNAVTVGRNGSNIQGSALDGTINTNRQTVQFTYVDSTKGWIPSLDATTGDYGASYTSATGGTVTESGDYKIHTFTGDGCFVVSSVGNDGGGGTIVSYMVVAGGGGSGGDRAGGGGAGGFREGKCTSDPYSASPLNAPTGITVTATTYPVTVGAGGAGDDYNGSGSVNCAGAGSNSIFSTITSAGGGQGASGLGGSLSEPGYNGGSGGGGASGSGGTSSGGTGNTPPVSPPQGNPGGTTPPSSPAASGGGGAAAAGGSPGGFPGGAGGLGVDSSITGTSTGYAGGGGGGASNPGPGGPASKGGAAGAPAPSCSPVPSRTGTANTGGGGGGGNQGGGPDSAQGAAGGKGIVIIRYKFQN